jgi:hypothetical protein
MRESEILTGLVDDAAGDVHGVAEGLAYKHTMTHLIDQVRLFERLALRS